MKRDAGVVCLFPGPETFLKMKLKGDRETRYGFGSQNTKRKIFRFKGVTKRDLLAVSNPQAFKTISRTLYINFSLHLAAAEPTHQRSNLYILYTPEHSFPEHLLPSFQEENNHQYGDSQIRISID